MKLTEGTKDMHGARRVAALVACAAFGIATCGSALALRVDVNRQRLLMTLRRQRLQRK